MQYQGWSGCWHWTAVADTLYIVQALQMVKQTLGGFSTIHECFLWSLKLGRREWKSPMPLITMHRHALVESSFQGSLWVALWAEEKEWVNKLSDASTSSHAFFPFGNSAAKARRSGVACTVTPRGSAPAKAMTEARHALRFSWLTWIFDLSPLIAVYIISCLLMCSG